MLPERGLPLANMDAADRPRAAGAQPEPAGTPLRQG